ncbi:FtsX-like permease family protein [Solidesulfovibrio sp.]|uniref:cell division protein FtsX n=1 Tax=Solidesulfovibrio sp. TaxID=2910990 RepID=UPI00262CEEF3|nr:FtsX-like permease family protein [Solidesulfovibrio sp.]
MIGRLLLAACRDGLRRPGPLLAALLGVAAVLYLGGLFALAHVNLEAALARDQGRVRFQVYWKPGADPRLVARQMDWMRALPGLVDTRAFAPDQALAVMTQSLGPGVDLSALAGKNPLPYTMLLTFRPPVADEGFARDVHDRLRDVEGVAEVHYDPREMDAAAALGLLARRAALPLAGLLTLLVGLVVAGMVRLTLLQRRDELEILRLVGASEGYIRLPFVAEAGLTGMAGAGLALVLLKGTQLALVAALDVPPLFLRLTFLPPLLSLAAVVAAGAIAALAGLAAAMESRA